MRLEQGGSIICENDFVPPFFLVNIYFGQGVHFQILHFQLMKR